MDLFDKMLELSGQGFFCSQILLILAMESEEQENPGLIRAMGGLNGGLGFTGNLCGALTGGCCFISYFAGKGEAEEMEDGNLNTMISRLVEWFRSEYGERYGGCNCDDILQGNPANKMTRCPGIVESVYFKAVELLSEYGVL